MQASSHWIKKTSSYLEMVQVADVVFSFPLGLQPVWIRAGVTARVDARRQKFYLTLQTRTPPTGGWKRGASAGSSQNNNFKRLFWFQRAQTLRQWHCEMLPNSGQRISLQFPLFMYLWHAIKPNCLDREMAPCLPTNKPSALGSSPLFIIHNLLWCQGQSDSIVMVKGKSAQPEFSKRTENPDKKKKKKTLKCLTAWILMKNLKTLEKFGKSDKDCAQGEENSLESSTDKMLD